MGRRGEHGFVEEFTPRAFVKAFHEADLGQLVGRAVVLLGPTLLRSAHDRRRGQFGAVVADRRMRLAAAAHQAGQFPGHPSPG